MGASSSILLADVSEDKREDVSRRFTELIASGKTEMEARDIILKELKHENSLHTPPLEAVIAECDAEIQQPKLEAKPKADFSVAQTPVPSSTVGEKVNKNKLSLIKKKARANSSQKLSTSGPIEKSVSAPIIGVKVTVEVSSEIPTAIIASTTDKPITQAVQEAAGKECSDDESISPVHVPSTKESTAAIDVSLPAVEEAATVPSKSEQESSTAVSSCAAVVGPSVLSKGELLTRYGEVEFLLRTPLTNDADIITATQAAGKGLAFIESITRYALDMTENRGMLLRWVLPFDSSTSIADQSNIGGAGSFAGSGTGSAISVEQEARFSAVIDIATKKELLEGALALRKLVRVKLSDEADLQQGIISVTDTHNFLVALQQRAAHDGVLPYDLLTEL
jgi:hypothetical protein